MNKICGFTCEYNKNGICQTTMCVKHTYVTFGTRQVGKTLYNKALEKNKELQQRIDNALCILNELYDCDIKEEDYNLIHLAIKTLRGSDKE